MDSHFETITYNVIDQFLDRVSSSSVVDKLTLWKVWKEMFSFPNEPSKKPKRTSLTDVSVESIPVDTKPVEAKPIETKPIETKPIETKPVEVKPVEVKPVEDKPAEAKPAEAKPAEAKPAEAKPVEAKPVEAKPVEDKPAEAKNDGCTYKFTRGDRTGQECGKKKKTDLFCTTHAK
jgi:hypothetical protein